MIAKENLHQPLDFSNVNIKLPFCSNVFYNPWNAIVTRFQSFRSLFQLARTATIMSWKQMTTKKMMKNSAAFQTSSVTSLHVPPGIPAFAGHRSHPRLLLRVLHPLYPLTTLRRLQTRKTRVKKCRLPEATWARKVPHRLSERGVWNGTRHLTLRAETMTKISKGNKVIAALIAIVLVVERIRQISKLFFWGCFYAFFSTSKQSNNSRD